MSTIRECPFCGEVVEVAVRSTGWINQFHGVCDTCGATGPIAAKEHTAEHLWNDRRSALLLPPAQHDRYRTEVMVRNPQGRFVRRSSLRADAFTAPDGGE